MPRRQVTLEIVLEIDSDLADSLKGDPGWMGTDGDCEPPISGQVLKADSLVWDLARRAQDRWTTSLRSTIVTASARFQDLDESSDWL
jgi:hypothetical protein